MICIRDELCLVVSISWAELERGATRPEGTHAALTHVAQELHPGFDTGNRLIIWEQPACSSFTEREHWSSLVLAMSLSSEVSLRGGMSWIPQAVVCHNLQDTLGLAGNSLAHRQSWEEKGLKTVTMCSFVLGRYQQRLC